jgi:hypothetical protein
LLWLWLTHLLRIQNILYTNLYKISRD